MRTTTQTESSKFKVILHFVIGGWTLSFFDDKKEIFGWVEAMKNKHGTIRRQEIK